MQGFTSYKLKKMWLHTAVSETFRELFTLSDPNRTGDARTKHKAKSVVKKYLQIQAGVPGKRKTETVVRYPNRTKTLTKSSERTTSHNSPPHHTKVGWRYSQAAKEGKKLENNAKEPFIGPVYLE